MGASMLLATWILMVNLMNLHVSSTPSESTIQEANNMVEVLRCFKTLQDSGKRIYVSYVSGTMRLFDSDGDEVSCDAGIQKRLRQKSDRRCIFSPIHCLFNKRIQSAKILTQWQQNSGRGAFAVRKRRSVV